MLYLSYYLEAHRAEYYDRLNAVRHDGAWEGWLKFFLRGVHEVSQLATRTAQAILQLREQHRQAIAELAGTGRAAVRLLDYLFEQPLVSVRMVERKLDCAYVTATKLVDQSASLGLLKEITGQQLNRRYRYEPFLAMFDAPPIGE